MDLQHRPPLTAAPIRPLAGRWEVPGYLRGFANADFTVRSYYLTALAVEGKDTLVVSHYLDRADGAPTPGCRLSVATRARGTAPKGAAG